MSEVSTRITDGNAEYEILSNGRTLSITILRDTFKKMQHKSGCLESNLLNHWIDHSQVEDDENEISISTQLDTNESTIADFKASVTGMQLNEFKDQMLPVLKAFLEFAYYIELGKQWETPLNPLNLVYVDNADGTGNIKAFYHNNKSLNEVGPDFLNDVIKMIIYLFVPEEENTSSVYPDLTAQDYFAQIDGNPDMIGKYGDDAVNELSDFVYNCQVNSTGESIVSVKDVFESLGDDKTPVEIEQDKGVVNDIKPDNLSDYMTPEQLTAQQQNQEKTTQSQQTQNNLSPKEQRLAEIEKQRQAQKEAKEKKKEEKRQAKENKRKEREQQLEQQKADAQAKKDKVAREKTEREQAAKDKAAKDKAAREQAAKDKAKREQNARKQAAAKSNDHLDRAALDENGQPKQNSDELLTESEFKPKKKRNLLIPGIIAGVLILGGGAYAIHAHNQKQAAQQAKTVATNQDPEKSPYFRKGSLDSGAQNWEDAAKQFDLFFGSGADGSTLNNNEVAAVFAAYLNTNQYQKILKNIGSPQTSTALINYLTAKKNLKVVNNLTSTQPIVSLAKAVQNDDSEGIIENAPKCDVSNNGILQLDICKAYAKENKLADGKKWAEEQKEPNKLINALKLYAKKNGISNKDINKAFS